MRIIDKIDSILFIFIFTIKEFMIHISSHSEMKIDKFLIDTFCILSGKGDIFNFESWGLFL